MAIAQHILIGSPAIGWGARVKGAVAGLLREWQVQRDLRQLGELDAVALHDIGLAPGGLEGAVRYGRPVRSGGARPRRAPVPALPSTLTEWR